VLASLEPRTARTDELQRPVAAAEPASAERSCDSSHLTHIERYSAKRRRRASSSSFQVRAVRFEVGSVEASGARGAGALFIDLRGAALFRQELAPLPRAW